MAVQHARQQLRSSFSTTWVRLATVTMLLALAALVGCASTPGNGRVAFEPRGPGFTFATIDNAAIDAMAFSVLVAKRTSHTDRMLGGTITAVEGGYTYAEPVVAPEIRPLDIRYRVGRDDVARFHVYPQADDIRERRAREDVTRWDMASVDETDPLHRPIYFLTPTLVVKAYHGTSMPVQEVARLDSSNDGMRVVMIASSMP